MAGRGSRFLDAINENPDYANPKPLIKISGKPMIAWALESLPFLNLKNRPSNCIDSVNPQDLIFICRKDHEDIFQISSVLKKLFGDAINTLFIENITRGAAETVLFAKKLVSGNEEVIISDSDHYFDGRYLYNEILNRKDDVSGIIPVWTPPDNEPKWSYSLINDDGYITDVGEKDKSLADRGALANIGAYYFNKWNDFIYEVESAILENDLTGAEGKREFYVAPIYDRLIKKRNLRIIPALTPKVWGLGTPKDVQYFETISDSLQ